jgi:uncharacterized repeat protein (TIGR04138 family)
MDDGRMIAELDRVIEGDPRYRIEAYLFVMSSLEFTLVKLGRTGHLSGGELLNGLKEYARERFGPMARTVFEHWGVKTTDDFGEIVFNLVGTGILGKTEQDSKDDFRNVYDFAEVFEKQYDWKMESGRPRREDE